jgi:ABC-type dipeptide/oligopeptide/nickel transport system ATPase component
MVHPCAPDPFAMFDGFQTASLKETDHIQLLSSIEEISRLIQHPMNMLASPMMVDGEQLQALIHLLMKENKQSVAQLCQALTPTPKERVTRTIVWLCKLGIAQRKET